MNSRIIAALVLPFLVQACGDSDKLPQSNSSAPIAQKDAGPIAMSAADQSGATPMAQREAVIALLNKRNGETRDLKMKPGEALRVGSAIVRLRACETTAPWENIQETGAFVQLDVQAPKEDKWTRVFSGWLFKERPERNVVEHPIYDVWVKSCAMKWPETGPDTLKASDRSGAKARSDSAPGPADNSADSSSSDTSESAASSNPQ